MKKTVLQILAVAMPLLTSNLHSQQASTTLNPTQVQDFRVDETNLALTHYGWSAINGTDVYQYQDPALTGGDFALSYHRYKFSHPNIANSDINSVVVTYAAKDHTGFPNSSIRMVIPYDACNQSGWVSPTTTDYDNTINCLQNSYFVSDFPTSSSSNVFSFTFLPSGTNPSLSAVLQNATDFTFGLYAGIMGYSDITTPISVVINYNTNPIANNTVSNNQNITCSGTPAALVGTTPTGGNNGSYAYQWQSSTDNINWNTISGATAINYTPSSISQTTYYRRIVSSAPQPSSTSNVVTVTIQAPAVPSGLSVQPLSSSSLNLSWNAASGASSYDIYDCSTNALVASTSGLSYSINSLAAATLYQYKVRSKCLGGLSSAFSACQQGYTNGSAPTNFVMQPVDCSNINLSWNAVPGAVSYNVYATIGSSSGNYSSTGTSLQIPVGLGGTIIAKVKAVFSGSIVGDYTSAQSASAYAFAPPTGVVAMFSPYSSRPNVSFSWNASPDATNYEIYEQSTSGTTLLGTTTTTRFTVFGVYPTSDQYYIKATSSQCTSGAIVYANGQMSTSCPVPTNFYARLLITGPRPKVTFTWPAVSSATSYDIYQYNSSTSSTLLGTATGTTLIVSGLFPLTSQFYIITHSTACPSGSDPVFSTNSQSSMRIARDESNDNKKVTENITEGITIYPNPIVNGVMKVEKDSQESTLLIISNVQGNIVLTKNLIDNLEEIDVRNLSSGMYIVKLQTEKEVLVKRIIIE